MIRARLVEVENAMATLKSAVSSYRQDKDEWPNCPDITAIKTSLGVGLAAVRRISAISVTDGVITATVANIHTMVDTKNHLIEARRKG